jgi:hypothetical protein
MKISVRYGLYTAAVIIVWMLLGYFLKLEKIMGLGGGYLTLIFYAIGIYFSVKHTLDKELTEASNPMLLLKAGLISASIISGSFVLIHLVSFEAFDHKGISTGSEIMQLIPMYILNLMIGGLLSVVLSFYYARKEK